MVPPPSQNTVEVCNQITLLILYIGSTLLTLLKVTDATIQFSDHFDLNVRLELITFNLQIFLLFVSEMSTSFTSYII